MGKLNRDEIRYALDEDVELKAELIGSTDTVTPEEKRMDDIHCADLDAEMDAERETARFGGEYEFYEDANEYGFPQMYQRGDSRIPGDEKDSPVCLNVMHRQCLIVGTGCCVLIVIIHTWSNVTTTMSMVYFKSNLLIRIGVAGQ